MPIPKKISQYLDHLYILLPEDRAYIARWSQRMSPEGMQALTSYLERACRRQREVFAQVDRAHPGFLKRFLSFISGISMRADRASAYSGPSAS